MHIVHVAAAEGEEIKSTPKCGGNIELSRASAAAAAVYRQ